MSYTAASLSKIVGMPVVQVRWYDKSGILTHTKGPNKYHYFDKDQISLLQEIKIFLDLGFDREDVKRIMMSSQEEKLVLLERFRTNLEERHRKLRDLLAIMDDKIEFYRKISDLTKQV